MKRTYWGRQPRLTNEVRKRKGKVRWRAEFNDALAKAEANYAKTRS